MLSFLLLLLICGCSQGSKHDSTVSGNIALHDTLKSPHDSDDMLKSPHDSDDTLKSPHESDDTLKYPHDSDNTLKSVILSGCTTCSTRIQCQVEGDNFLQRRDAAHECSCLDFCSSTLGCSWYTWFNGRDPDDPKSCYLFSSCAFTLDCYECFSGPTICPSTTTPLTTSTITTTSDNNPAEVIFIAGGINSPSTELLDISSSSLPSTSSLPDSRHFHTSHFLPDPPSSKSILYQNSHSSGTILICGGEHKQNFTRHSCIATTDPVTGHWHHHSTTVRERYRHSGAMVGGTVHLLAGITANRTTELWDNGNWTFGAEMPHKPGGGSCAASSSSSTIIVSGGYLTMEKVSLLDVTTGDWVNLPDMPQGRYGHGCTEVRVEGNTYMVVAGGESIGKKLRSSDVLDVGNRRWLEVGDMNQARNSPQMVTVKDRVVVLGGQDENYQQLKSVEELKIDDWTWEVLDVNMTEGRVWFSAVVIPWG